VLTFVLGGVFGLGGYWFLKSFLVGWKTLIHGDGKLVGAWLYSAMDPIKAVILNTAGSGSVFLLVES